MRDKHSSKGARARAILFTKKSTPVSSGDDDEDEEGDDDDDGVVGDDGLAIDDGVGDNVDIDDDCSDWARRVMQSFPNKPGRRRVLE